MIRENLDLQSKCKRRIDETLHLSEQIEYVYSSHPTCNGTKTSGTKGKNREHRLNRFF